MNLIKNIKNDILFLYKYKLFHVLLFIIIFYAFILFILEGLAYQYAKLYILLSDPIILGFFFIGGIFLIEKNEGIIKYIFITTTKPFLYLLSKSIVLAITGTIVAIAISIIKTNDLKILILLTVFVANIFMTLFGQLVALKSKTVNDYLGYGMIAMMILIVPFFLAIIFDKILILEYNPLSIICNIFLDLFVDSYQNFLINFIILIIFTIILFYIVNKMFKKILYEGKL